MTTTTHAPSTTPVTAATTTPVTAATTVTTPTITTSMFYPCQEISGMDDTFIVPAGSVSVNDQVPSSDVVDTLRFVVDFPDDPFLTDFDIC